MEHSFPELGPKLSESVEAKLAYCFDTSKLNAEAK